jgi:hypothetical protein
MIPALKMPPLSLPTDIFTVHHRHPLLTGTGTKNVTTGTCSRFFTVHNHAYYAVNIFTVHRPPSTAKDIF